MKRVAWVVCGLVLAFSPPVWAENEADKLPSPLLSMGQQYYEQYCSACHGQDGHGNGPVAPILRKAPADLTRIAERRGGTFPEAEIAQYIDGRAEVSAHGPRDMPVWGRRFSEKFGGGALGEEFVRGHLLLLLEYLKSIQR